MECFDDSLHFRVYTVRISATPSRPLSGRKPFSSSSREDTNVDRPPFYLPCNPRSVHTCDSMTRYIAIRCSLDSSFSPKENRLCPHTNCFNGTDAPRHVSVPLASTKNSSDSLPISENHPPHPHPSAPPIFPPASSSPWQLGMPQAEFPL